MVRTVVVVVDVTLNNIVDGWRRFAGSARPIKTKWLFSVPASVRRGKHARVQWVLWAQLIRWRKSARYWNAWTLCATTTLACTGEKEDTYYSTDLWYLLHLWPRFAVCTDNRQARWALSFVVISWRTGTDKKKINQSTNQPTKCVCVVCDTPRRTTVNMSHIMWTVDVW